jgi:anaerobic selenocysteine-containing dehydrogenase
MDTVRTFCRICEPSCGLVAHVDGGQLVKLTPDREHPVTKGFACHKGLAAVDIHRDPDRLDHPRLRAADGTWSDVGWDEAMAHTADRLRAIAAEHGPGAVSAYIGNPTAFNALASLHVAPLLRALDVRRTFSSGTQDCANKFVASEAVFGTSTVHPIPDLEHTDLCLVIGENPRASQASFYSIPNVLGELRRANARGARIVFVNPRRIETPEKGVGDTVLIKPDTDVWFLAALLAEIDALNGFDTWVLRPPRSACGGAPRVPRRVPSRPGHRGHGSRRRRDPLSWPRRGWRRRERRSTRPPASTWAVRAHSRTGSCTCCRSSRADWTSRAGT